MIWFDGIYYKLLKRCFKGEVIASLYVWSGHKSGAEDVAAFPAERPWQWVPEHCGCARTLLRLPAALVACALLRTVRNAGQYSRTRKRSLKVVANAVWMLTCTAHTSWGVWGPWTLAGLYAPPVWDYRRLSGLVPVTSCALPAPSLCKQQIWPEKGCCFERALGQVPPRSPSNLNYNFIHLIFCWISFTFLWSTLMLFTKAEYWTT